MLWGASGLLLHQKWRQRSALQRDLKVRSAEHAQTHFPLSLPSPAPGHPGTASPRSGHIPSHPPVTEPRHSVTSWLLYMSYEAHFGQTSTTYADTKIANPPRRIRNWSLQKCADLTTGGWSGRLFFEELFLAVD